MPVCRKCGVRLVAGKNWWPSSIESRDYACIGCQKARARRRYQEQPRGQCIDCGTTISPRAIRCRSCAATKQMKRRWDEGEFDDEWQKKVSRAREIAWENGLYDSEDTRRKYSEALKETWNKGLLDDLHNEEWRKKMAEITKAHWEEGVFDGVFQSPTSIELQVATALDICGVEHQSQYRPDGYSRPFDEFIPPNTLIEIQGDYWHGPERPKQQKRDTQKAQWAVENGYELIVIWEHEIKERGAWAIIAERFNQQGD